MKMITQNEIDNMRRALEALWTDMGALARNPLVEQLGLMDGWAEQDRLDVYKRAMALIEAILAAARRLKDNGDAAAFVLLDRAYGLAQQHFEPRPIHATLDELAAQAGLSPTEYERKLDAALVNLRNEL